jgi:hypothetical protein
MVESVLVTAPVVALRGSCVLVEIPSTQQQAPPAAQFQSVALQLEPP